MNSKGRSSAAWCAEPQPVETGLSVDDRPNELNIAFWVISSVGAASPLLLHIIYVSVRAPSLSFSISLALSFHAPPQPHTQTHRYLFLSHSVLHTLFLSLPFCPFHPFAASFSSVSIFPSPGIPLSPFFSLIPFQLFFTLFLSRLSPSLSLSSFILFISASFCIPSSLSSSLFFFFCLTLSEPFFLSSYLSLWASLSSLSHFLSLFPSLSFLSHAYEVALHCVSHPLQYSEPLFKYYSLRC